VLTPFMMKTLQLLKKRGVILIALSTHPHQRLEADIHRGRKIRHLRLDEIFDFIYTARPFPWGKGKVMERVLKKLKIPKIRALLIGDSYVYDYLSARKVGIDCFLIKTPYLDIPKGRKVTHIINGFGKLFK
jgi:FMN phosphatase YigB (HAD superfamily)